MVLVSLKFQTEDGGSNILSLYLMANESFKQDLENKNVCSCTRYFIFQRKLSQVYK